VSSLPPRKEDILVSSEEEAGRERKQAWKLLGGGKNISPSR